MAEKKDDLWIDGPDLIANAPPPPPRARTAKEKVADTWAKIPHGLGLKLARDSGNSALAVLLALEHSIYEGHNNGIHTNRVKLTNNLLKQYGITRHLKRRGLRHLAAAGVITVKQRGKEAPIVTHHWYTRTGELKVGPK
jgi:hypothetical protein